MTSPSAPALDGRPAWWIYRGTGYPAAADSFVAIPPPPAWRAFAGAPVLPLPPSATKEATRRLGHPAVNPVPPDPQQVEMVNAALYLRRPLLVTGQPGTGKSSLAYMVARELGLGRVLRWPVTSGTKLSGGLYQYDAIGRVQAGALHGSDADIGRFVQLGPLGTALLPYDRPRVLLIDELDKSDIDLPNDLLSIFEDGEYKVPELARVASTTPEVEVFTDDPAGTATIRNGRVACREFPFIVITSNGERDFPPAFLRRCLRLEMAQPTVDQLAAMVAAHFSSETADNVRELVATFAARSTDDGGLAADQLLNAVHLVTSGAYEGNESWPRLRESLWRELSTSWD